MADRLKDIPTLDRNGSNLPAVAGAVQETIQVMRGYRGDPLDKVVTWRDLTEQGLVRLSALQGAARGRAPGRVIIPPGAGGVEEPDLTPPPTPTGLTVTPGITYIIIECDPQLYSQGHGHDRTIVYGAKRATGAPAPTFADAVPICEFLGTVFAYATEPSTTWCIWIKWKSIDGVLSVAPAGGTNGVQVTTGLDVDLMVQAMTGPGNPFTILAFDTTIDGVLYPAGVYATSALIADAQISRAKIKDLAVDNAKIANVSVAKLTAGSLAVGEHIQSTGFISGSAGFRITGAGNAEFSSIIARGTVFASAGQIGAAVIDATGVESDNYVPDATGWRLDGATGQAEFQNIKARGDIRASEIVVGSSPAISGTTMTGSGARINAVGSFAMGNAFANITFNGAQLTLNGPVVAARNLQSGSASLVSANSAGAWGVVECEVTVTADDIPTGQTTIPVVVTGCQDVIAVTFFDMGVNQGPAYTAVGNLVAALPPNAGLQSYTTVYNATPGTYKFACFNHGAGNAADVANTRQRSITAQVLKR